MSKFFGFTIVVLFSTLANAQIAYMPPPTCQVVGDYAYRGYLNPRAIATINALDGRRFYNPPIFISPRVDTTSGCVTIYSPPAWCEAGRYFVKRDILPFTLPVPMPMMVPAPGPNPVAPPANTQPSADRPVAPDGGQINIRPAANRVEPSSPSDKIIGVARGDQLR